MSTTSNLLASFFKNMISLELPLKYPEVYHVTYIPDFPGPLVNLLFCHPTLSVLTIHFQTIEIRTSGCTTPSEPQNTRDDSHSLTNEKTVIVAQPDSVTLQQSGELDTITVTNCRPTLYTNFSSRKGAWVWLEFHRTRKQFRDLGVNQLNQWGMCMLSFYIFLLLDIL